MSLVTVPHNQLSGIEQKAFDQALAFISLVIEDYGDEWMWRPAMRWRWVPQASRWALGWRVAKSNMPEAPSRLLGWIPGRR